MKSPEINLSSLKDLVGNPLKKLGFLKNNLALLVPIIIVVMAALLFIPTKLLSDKLRGTIEKQSVQASKNIDRLIRDVNEAAEAEALEQYINAYAQDANQIEDMMKQATMRELLSYKLFPDTNETSPLLFEPFREEFISGVEAMLASVRSGGPPTDAEIRVALESAPSRSMYGRQGGRSSAFGQGAYGGGGGGYGQGGYGGALRGMGMMTEVDRKIIEKVCEDKARAAKVYATPMDLDGFSFWSDWKFENWNKAVRDCWYWQMGYWITEDIFATIGETNKGATNITNAPVKRIMYTSFTQSKMASATMGPMGGTGRRRRSARQGEKQTPIYVTGIREAMTGAPCTGRITSEEFDIMHFGLRVVIGAQHVMPFMQELCSAKTHKFRGFYGDQPEQTYKHNQITVLESSIVPVERESYDHRNHRYGDDAVVELDLICEYLFDVAAYGEIQPQQVKDDILGITEETK